MTLPTVPWRPATGTHSRGKRRLREAWHLRRDVGQSSRWEPQPYDLGEISYNGLMDSPDQADREELLADVQKGTEQRMHSAADVLPDSELGT
jgi:hypothetical protein